MNLDKDRLYLNDILECCNKIEKYIEGVDRSAFLKNEQLQDALLRNITVMGDAIKKLNSDIKEKYPDIPWKEFAGMRDKVIHQYFKVDLEIVWQTAIQDIPKIKLEIEKHLLNS